MTILDKIQMTEEDIKLNFITPALLSKGWKDKITMETKVQFTDGKINLKGNVAVRGDAKKADYVLYMRKDYPIAIVEAKDNNHTISFGMQQAKTYAQMMDIKFAYSSNGDGFEEYDFLTGQERQISMDEFPTPEELLARDLNESKAWVKERSKGTTCYGLIASSGALRLKPEGIFVKNSIDVPNWFLNGKDDVRSCYALEDVVTEFDIQGLEIDYSVLAWDADFRFVNGEWTYNNFTGNKWNKVNSEENRLYLKNAYRVLMTRARQGMAIFIPKGSDDDATRQRSFYDGTYNCLKEIMS